jgi:predicted ATP-dependent protease
VGGSSSELLLFLKPNNSSNLETSINFPSNKVSDSQQKSVREIIYNLLKNSSKLGEEIKKYDVYILRLRTGNTKYTGSSSGVAHYLALYSALHKIPLPRNLASTATVEGKRVGKIGGLKYKIEAVINKSNPIDTFILSEDNRKDKNCPEQSYEDIPLHITSKIKQAHFISQVDQIETALQEIIREPNRKIVHSCEKNEVPRKEEPEKKPSFPIGSEQLLSLITELRIREKGNLGDQKDF